jgi:REP element-mobilizing transposase RayT
MTEHVHLVLARHRLTVEQIVTQLKGSATRSLEQAGIHPLQYHARKNGRLPKCWARGEWKVFLSSPDHLARAVGYVLANPVKEHLPSQNWSFVDDWRSALSM